MSSDEEVLLVPKGHMLSERSLMDRLTSDFEVEKARTEAELNDVIQYLSSHTPLTRLELSHLLRQQAVRVQKRHEADERVMGLLTERKTE